MPTTYAHWAFGKDCIDTMPTKYQKIINQHRDIYDLAVHGPDIFFYDLAHPNIPKYGSQMHNIPAHEFFRKCKSVYKEHEEKDEMMAYILGFLTHFTLDSSAHSYVERKIQETPVSHNFVESQWDRHCIIIDDRIPNLVDRAESLKPNKQNAKVISYFFPFTAKEVLRTCKMQRTVVKLTNAVSPRKQEIFQKGLRKIKQYNNADLFMGFEEDSKCKDSNLRLDKLRTKALKLYPKLMNNLLEYFKGKEELDKYFDHDFSYWPDCKKIKVLSYKEELNYKIK